MKKKKILGYYDYTVILTYLGMLFAFCGILKSLNLDYLKAIVCLMIAGLCDMFDGTVASTKDRDSNEKKYGIQIDSLSDLISFGVLPAIFVYMISGKNVCVGFISSVFVLCALIRLAFFNVLEDERQRTSTEKQISYLGVPVTTVAILMPIAYLCFTKQLFKNIFCFPMLLCVLGIGFLLPIEIKKPTLLGKVCIIIVGTFEVIGILFSMGWEFL